MRGGLGKVARVVAAVSVSLNFLRPKNVHGTKEVWVGFFYRRP